MKKTLLAAALATVAATAAVAAPEKYVLDASHSQILFSYNHLGFSTTWGLFSGFEGDVMFDQENPAGSSVTVSMPTKSMFTGWEERFGHFMSQDFFGAKDGDLISFSSTGIEVTGEATAQITGDLTINGTTKPVVLDAILNQSGDHPMAGKPWAGFDASATVLRSDFNLGKFAPFVSDEVQIKISIEAMKAE
ncbi:YceI family protein [Parasedimentitalea psychrophila]|uniref:YceI family protein n=1 Tax=Parasedimentitalea psychrophila TaxID=2997337 RepID=A0A9Y2KWQ8_9RHOB|nr:YceI family protein [Parasedimentitalea psychrophila]WIY24551.1 YceI family protein [Parasedimentitalea psychrophila]